MGRRNHTTFIITRTWRFYNNDAAAAELRACASIGKRPIGCWGGAA
ncbi:MAG: hypothetical protein ACYTEX_19365 [Planctomycetota bacterium]